MRRIFTGEKSSRLRPANLESVQVSLSRRTLFMDRAVARLDRADFSSSCRAMPRIFTGENESVGFERPPRCARGPRPYSVWGPDMA